MSYNFILTHGKLTPHLLWKHYDILSCFLEKTNSYGHTYLVVGSHGC